MARRPGSRSTFPLLELSRFCERQKRDFQAALIHAENALAILRAHHLRLGATGAREREDELVRRVGRLRERVERQATRRRVAAERTGPAEADRIRRRAR
jgi:hypothetical protein